MPKSKSILVDMLLLAVKDTIRTCEYLKNRYPEKYGKPEKGLHKNLIVLLEEYEKEKEIEK